MEKELILEIGTEEIPAGFMKEAIRDLSEISGREFDENAISHGGISSFGTPRRLTLRVTDLSGKQEDQTRESYGPPIRMAFDDKGNPTDATVGFAKSQGIEVSDLVTVKRDRGEFLAAVKQIKGQKTEILLKEMLPRIIGALRFRKSMKWGDGETAFARPIRWILAVYGGKVVRFSIGEVKSSDKTYGHRFLKPKPFKVNGWNNYLTALESGYVVLDQKKREEAIRKGIAKLAKRIGGMVEEDKELLETVTYLVEYPVVMKGDFEDHFLNLPKEVLISVMKNHQKYFPVFSKSGDGKLLPYFIFVSGTPVKDSRVVIKGNERVIRARFSDARFFYDEDRSMPLSDKIGRLKDMVFLSNLGTYYDKTERLTMLAFVIGKALDKEKSLHNIVRAAELSKADLATQMVFEFPELQGIMGRYYALLSGEKEEVARAIEEQYKPTSREGRLPETIIGAILSIADKVDTITACFISGLIPTGTSDPYALRRQAIGIINIILGKEIHLNMNQITDIEQWHLNTNTTINIQKLYLIINYMSHAKKLSSNIKKFHSNIDDLFFVSLGAIAPQTGGEFSDSINKTLNEISGFMKERFRNIMTSDGFPQDIVDAVISARFDDIVEVKKKIEALTEFRMEPDFESLGTTFKRVVNIVKDQPRNQASQNLFVEPVERELYLSFIDTREKVGGKMSERNYPEALSIMRTLKEPVDKFFEHVLVMDENAELRKNRLSMLWEIRDLFFRIADFSKLST